MDRKIGGLKSVGLSIRMIVCILWVIFSTVLYGIVIIPLSLVARPFARELGRFWCKNLLAAGGVRVKARIASLDKNERYVFVANHQSALDIPVLIAGIKNQLSFIAKKELFFIPFFGWGIAALGHIWIDRSNARKARVSITRAVRKLEREHVSLVLFPEGTRSPDGKVGEFKQGSFTIAIESGAKVVPVAIKNTGNLLPKKSSWIFPGTAYLEFAEPIDTHGMKVADKAQLARRVRDAIVSMINA